MLTKITIAAMLFTTPVMAQTSFDCNEIAEYGQLVMVARQSAVPITDVNKMVDESFPSDGQVSKSLKRIAIHAYQEPAYATDEMKKRAIKEFSNKLYLICAGG